MRFVTLVALMILSGGGCDHPRSRLGQFPKRIRIIVPGGPGGGWDTTARETAEVLKQIGAFDRVTVQNVPGAGGGRGLKTLINEGADRNDLIMVSSTPLLLRNLNGTFPQSFRDVTPLAATIADFQTIVVRSRSSYESLTELANAIRASPGSISIVGGSSPGSMDHVAAAMVLTGGDVSWRDWNYVPAGRGGGDAMTMLLSSQHIAALSTGVSEAVGMMESGKVRVLCVTSAERIPRLPEVPTAVEQGFDATFTNWRGFFGPPGMTDQVRDEYAARLGDAILSEPWAAISARRGWLNQFVPGEAFEQFLADEEQKLKELLLSMGFVSRKGQDKS